MEEEDKKYDKYEMEVRGYGGDYSNNLHATRDLIKNLKVLLGTKMIVYSEV